MYMHTYARAYINIYIHTYLHTYIIHTYIRTCLHAYIHKNKHTYIHTYIHTYTTTGARNSCAFWRCHCYWRRVSHLGSVCEAAARCRKLLGATICIRPVLLLLDVRLIFGIMQFLWWRGNEARNVRLLQRFDSSLRPRRLHSPPDVPMSYPLSYIQQQRGVFPNVVRPYPRLYKNYFFLRIGDFSPTSNPLPFPGLGTG